MTKEAKITLLIAALFTIGMGLSNVFVGIFIWKETSTYSAITWYHLMQFTMIPLTMIFAGFLSKKFNGMWPLRIGIGLFILFFLLILVFRKSISDLIIPFGILFGIASGFYWLAIQVLVFDYTSVNNRDTYNGYNGFICSIAGAISPLVAAFIIDILESNTGYYIVFFISLLFFVAQILVSLLIRPDHYHEKLAFDKLWHGKGEDWHYMQHATMSFGLRNGVIFFVIQILIFKTTGSELSLGKITFFTACITSLFFLIEQHIVKPRHRVLALSVGATFMFISVLPLVFKISFNTLLIHSIINAIFLPFFIVPVNSATFNILEHTKEQPFRIEYIINKEIRLHIGRVVSLIILLLLLKFLSHKHTLNYYLLFLGCSQFISLYFLKKISIWEQ